MKERLFLCLKNSGFRLLHLVRDMVIQIRNLKISPVGSGLEQFLRSSKGCITYGTPMASNETDFPA